MLFVDDYRVKKMALKGEWLKEWEVLLDVVEADKVINVPIAKHHSPLPPDARHEELARARPAGPATSSIRASTRPWSTWPPSSSRS